MSSRLLLSAIDIYSFSQIKDGWGERKGEKKGGITSRFGGGVEKGSWLFNRG